MKAQDVEVCGAVSICWGWNRPWKRATTNELGGNLKSLFNYAASTASTFVNVVHVHTPTFNPAAVQRFPPNPTLDFFP